MGCVASFLLAVLLVHAFHCQAVSFCLNSAAGQDMCRSVAERASGYTLMDLKGWGQTSNLCTETVVLLPCVRMEVGTETFLVHGSCCPGQWRPPSLPPSLPNLNPHPPNVQGPKPKYAHGMRLCIRRSACPRLCACARTSCLQATAGVDMLCELLSVAPWYCQDVLQYLGHHSFGGVGRDWRSKVPQVLDGSPPPQPASA